MPACDFSAYTVKRSTLTLIVTGEMSMTGRPSTTDQHSKFSSMYTSSHRLLAFTKRN